MDWWGAAGLSHWGDKAHAWVLHASSALPLCHPVTAHSLILLATQVSVGHDDRLGKLALPICAPIRLPDFYAFLYGRAESSVLELLFTEISSL